MSLSPVTCSCGASAARNNWVFSDAVQRTADVWYSTAEGRHCGAMGFWFGGARLRSGTDQRQSRSNCGNLQTNHQSCGASLADGWVQHGDPSHLSRSDCTRERL